MTATDIMYPNEMIKKWLAKHNRIDGEAHDSLASSTSAPKTKYPAALRDFGIGGQDRSERLTPEPEHLLPWE